MLHEFSFKSFNEQDEVQGWVYEMSGHFCDTSVQRHCLLVFQCLFHFLMWEI